MTSIIMIILPDGKAKIETNGFIGSSCREASQFIEQALGQCAGETLKPEYFSDNNINTEQSETVQ